MMCVAVGTPFDGVSLHGPFDDAEQAGSWAEAEADGYEWWIAELRTPALAYVQPRENWKRDDLQFPRLLAELFGFVDDDVLRPVAESMDLELSEVIELFNRAEDAWERIKIATT